MAETKSKEDKTAILANVRCLTVTEMAARHCNMTWCASRKPIIYGAHMIQSPQLFSA